MASDENCAERKLRQNQIYLRPRMDQSYGCV